MSYSTEFQQNPIVFLRKYSLSPPDGTAGDVIKSWLIGNAGNIKDGGNGPVNSTISLKSAGISKYFVNFKKHNLLPECLTVALSDTRKADDDFAQFWLPWDSLAITRHKLPPIPNAIVGGNEDLDTFPRFFMTAGINGCSVFVDGPGTQPTVYHAGISGTLDRPAKEFWKEQLAEAFQGTAKQGRAPVGQVHSNQYMNRDAEVITRYVEWTKSENPRGFPLSVESCFGSVVGVRFGRTWSFYLQENMWVQDIEVLKRSQIYTGVYDGGAREGQKYYRMKGTNAMVDRQVTVQHNRFLPDSRKKVYTRKINDRCLPVRVSEIFPTRTFAGELKDFKVVAR